jgi:hypothetical protein
MSEPIPAPDQTQPADGAPPADAQPQPEPAAPRDKSDLVAEAMDRLGIPSYEAWAMTDDDLTARLEN